ncbi:extended synaptotagmin-2 [Trichonephila inaurata madagascariensis]|uniref:Extended synaptotagmin-2 n=1 Tax=Trichonephila inaurata madagascariensis TaxID=2747483 RepID=A0A8X6WQC7_9ARAC|nr:extended synaptotagmin-2 [Trichonephila inaurata madagascariensis]
MTTTKYNILNKDSTKEINNTSDDKLVSEIDAANSISKTVKETVESARSVLRFNVYAIAGGFISLTYGAYLVGHSGFGATSMLCIGLGVAVSAWMMRNNYLTERDIGLSIDRSVSLNEKECILARLTDLPSWVFFPETERVEWVNKILKQLWPYVGVYVKEMLKETMEPSIRESLPSYLQSFRFEKIILGDMPPRIGGVKVYQENVSRNEIIMDLEIRYSGDCNIQVGVKKFKAGIKDLQIYGTIRVVMKPLVKIIPLVGGVTVFFLNRPRIDFNLTNVANVLDMPGLGDILRKAVSEQVAAMMVLPNKFPVQLIQDIPLKSLKFSPPAGVLRLNIVEARELVKADVGVLGMGKSDPYCIISVGIQEFRTPVVKNTINPKWNFFCEPIIDQFVGQNIDIEVMDEDQSSKDDFLGRVSIDISKLVKKRDISAWLQLEDTKSGSLNIQSTWLTLSDNSEDLAQQLLDIRNINSRSTMYSAVLLVFLDSAKHLPNINRGAEEPSTQVHFTVTGFKESSAIRPHSNDPIWEETFRFLLHNPEIQDLTVEVTDTKSNKPIGMTRVHLCRLLREKEMQLEEPFQLLGAGPNSKILMTLQLRILVPCTGKTSFVKKEEMSKREKSPDDKDSRSTMDLPDLPDVAPSARPLSPSTPTIQDMIQTTLVPAVDNLEFQVEKSDATLLSSPPETSDSTSQKSSPIKTPSPVKKKTSSPPSISGDSIKSNRSIRSNSGIIKIQLTIRYSIPRNKLVVVVHKAKNLPHKDGEDKPDPYVKIYMTPDRNKETKQKTQVIKNTCNPIFDESLEFDVNMSEVANYSLEVTVISKSGSMMFPRGKVLGKTVIDLSQQDLSKAATEWYDLDATD